MQAIKRCHLTTDADKSKQVVLKLTANNHPGVMSHICSLFSRRAYNMDGILCMPAADEKTSSIWILVKNNCQLEQIIKQLQKLEDVHIVCDQNGGYEIFMRLKDYFN